MRKWQRGDFERSHWPSAATLLSDRPIEAGAMRSDRHLDLATSVTARSEEHAAAIRARSALFHLSFSRRSTSPNPWVVDFGDVDSPTPRVAPSAWRRPVEMGPEHRATAVLGGDNAATWHALRALSGGDYSNIDW